MNTWGPVLHEEQPGVKILGFDHNKDHVVDWATVLYGDDATKMYLDGIGVHWYGGLNTQHLNTTHFIAPDKFILATEACNCPGVIYRDQPQEWWSRAEKLSIDILEDIKWWTVGWVDWNLMVNAAGGPNHVGNNCDANIICDPQNTTGFGPLVVQASYYYMGHFSRFLPPGSRRISTTSTVQVEDELVQSQVEGQKLYFIPCAKNLGSYWRYDQQNMSLSVESLPGLCAEFNSADGEAILMMPCDATSSAQAWTVANNGTAKIFTNSKSALCLTELQVGGQRVGLDPGVDANAGFAETCHASDPTSLGDGRNTRHQNFYAKGNFPDSFQLSTDSDDCMLPVGTGDVLFDAVAFQTPEGDISLVAMNLKETSLEFDIYDVAAQGGYGSLQLPPHSITTFMWPSSEGSSSSWCGSSDFDEQE